MSEAIDVATLSTIYENWERYQEQLIKAIELLTQEQLALTVSDDLRSVRQLILHIIRTRAGWMHRMMGEGGPEIAEIAAWKWDGSDQAERTTPQLVADLRTTWECIRSALDRWSSKDMSYIYSGKRPDGQDYSFTRAWVIWHLIEHDLHHGGELSYSLGINGIPGVDI